MNFSAGEMADNCSDSTGAENCTWADPTGLVPSYPDITGWLQFSITTQFLLIFVIFFTNATVLVLVAYFKTLQVLENSFIVSLAAADGLLSVAMIPGVDITLNPTRAGNKYACLLLWCSIMFSSSASVFSLLALSLDRYLKIVYPLHQYMTAARVCGILAFVWSYTFITAFVLPFVGLNGIKDPFFVCFDFKDVFNIAHLQFYCYINGLAPFLFMFVMYGKIFRVVWEKLRAESDQIPAGAEGVGRSKQWLRRELKVIKKLTMVLGTTAVSWIPTTCMLLRQIYDPTYYPTFQTRVILSTLTYMNSAVNPLLYSLRIQPFREALSKVFCRRCQRPNAIHPSGRDTA
ncbi:adenosine receptor A2b-like [Patiria miniata]|uniref:G-protein coupled receptors family 1 profile domain-containing protein n=1 Tax=Patiria miniata TaxID=46514 RepID=A0A914AAL5_PATMI|nr:adenosine receptor A2b-like [Patiria miniata]